MDNLFRYTNGAGHLIMSILFASIGLVLILTGYSPVGIPLLMTVASAWFIPGAAKSVAHQVTKTVSQHLNDPGDKIE